MNFENHLNNDILLTENTSNFQESEILSYGLDLGENLDSTESQLNPVQPFSIELLSVLETNSLESTELVFIDSAVTDIQTLTENISRATEVIVLDSDRDELLQISEHLSNYEDLDAVHIVSHGESGQLSFDNASLNSDNLSEYEDLLQDWSHSLDSEADLLLYGCDLTSSEAGSSFVRELSQLTGADISASIDTTGQGGNWQLETEFGQVEATSIFDSEIEETYQHTLAAGDVTFTDLPDFGSTDFNSSNIDFASIPTDDLSIFAEGGLDFSTLDPNTLSNIDFNQIPTEDLSILADAGLKLEPLSTEEISQINLNTFSGLNYLEGVDFASIDSLGGETTFAQLSDSVIANADLFAYKNSTLSLESGLTIDSLSQLSQSDLKALDYSFTGDEAFDGDFYLANNPDIRDAGVNPFTHFMETGVSEGRDPNATFDSDFYSEDNPDVRDAGINSFTHFIESGASEGRYPNPVSKSFGESDGTLVASADLSGIQFEEFKTLAEDTNEIAVAPALAIPFIVVEGTKVLAITAASLGIIQAASNIQELLSGSDVTIFVPEGDIDSSIPPFELGEAGTIDPESFPNSNEFLDDILNGRFEFPDAEEGGVYFLNSVGDIDPSTPTGSKRSPLDVEPGTNSPEIIGGREFTGHALDRIQGRGITPSTVENTIQSGETIPGKVPGTSAHYDSVNNITVITDSSSGRVITASFGRISQ